MFNVVFAGSGTVEKRLQICLLTHCLDAFVLRLIFCVMNITTTRIALRNITLAEHCALELCLLRKLLLRGTYCILPQSACPAGQEPRFLYSLWSAFKKAWIFRAARNVLLTHEYDCWSFFLTIPPFVKCWLRTSLQSGIVAGFSLRRIMVSPSHWEQSNCHSWPWRACWAFPTSCFRSWLPEFCLRGWCPVWVPDSLWWECLW